GLGQSRFERDARLPAEQLAGARVIGFDVPLLTGSTQGVIHAMIATRAFECRKHRVGNVIDRKTFATAKIDRLAIARGVLQRANPCVNYIANVDKIARLLSIAENRDRLSA